MSGTIAFIVAVTGLVGAVAGLLALFRKVAAVHVLVNSQLSRMVVRVEQLTRALQDAGIDVPDRPAVAPPHARRRPRGPGPSRGAGR